MIAYVNVRYETHDRGRIAHVTVDHAAKLNSLSSEVMDQFIDRFRGLAADLALRAVVLTGAGDRAFIGGANIDEMSRWTAHRRRVPSYSRCTAVARQSA